MKRELGVVANSLSQQKADFMNTDLERLERFVSFHHDASSQGKPTGEHHKGIMQGLFKITTRDKKTGVVVRDEQIMLPPREAESGAAVCEFQSLKVQTAMMKRCSVGVALDLPLDESAALLAEVAVACSDTATPALSTIAEIAKYKYEQAVKKYGVLAIRVMTPQEHAIKVGVRLTLFIEHLVSLEAQAAILGGDAAIAAEVEGPALLAIGDPDIAGSTEGIGAVVWAIVRNKCMHCVCGTFSTSHTFQKV
jgi:hypothetical protein